MNNIYYILNENVFLEKFSYPIDMVIESIKKGDISKKFIMSETYIMLFRPQRTKIVKKFSVDENTFSVLQFCKNGVTKEILDQNFKHIQKKLNNLIDILLKNGILSFYKGGDRL